MLLRQDSDAREGAALTDAMFWVCMKRSKVWRRSSLRRERSVLLMATRMRLEKLLRCAEKQRGEICSLEGGGRRIHAQTTTLYIERIKRPVDKLQAASGSSAKDSTACTLSRAL